MITMKVILQVSKTFQLQKLKDILNEKIQQLMKNKALNVKDSYIDESCLQYWNAHINLCSIVRQMTED